MGRDIDIVQMPRSCLDEQGYLRPLAERIDAGDLVDVVLRNNKGMSASLSIESLPDFRKPPEFGGTGKDPLWQIDQLIEKGAKLSSLSPKQYRRFLVVNEIGRQQQQMWSSSTQKIEDRIVSLTQLHIRPGGFWHRFSTRNVSRSLRK